MTSETIASLPLSETDFPKTWEVLRHGVSEGVASGMVAGCWLSHFPRQIYVTSHGHRRALPSVLPISVETVFDLASITKVFATAALAAALVDRGWIDWESPISLFFPDYPHTRIRLKHLLSHTAGYPHWQPFWEKLREYFAPELIESVPIRLRQAAMRSMALSVAPEAEPGARAVYSDISFLILGFVLEEVTKMPLDQAVKRFVWNPMGIHHAFFHRVTQSAAGGVLEAVAATENCPWRGAVLQGQVHDDNCWAMGGYGGHAGAFGTAQDLLKFSKVLLEGFFSPRVTNEMWTRVLDPPGCERTLGWDTPSGEKSSVGRLFSVSTVGHLGFTGTSLWIDRKAGLAVTLLTNRVHPSRENWKIKEFRPQFHDALRTDLRKTFGEGKI